MTIPCAQLSGGVARQNGPVARSTQTPVESLRFRRSAGHCPALSMDCVRDGAMHGSNIELERLDESEVAPFAFEIIGMVDRKL